MQSRVKIEIEHLSFSYGKHQVLSDVNLLVRENSITAITGPSGVGKSTLLTMMNRLWETEPCTKMEGMVKMVLDGKKVDIYAPQTDLSALRRKVGMVFQIPNPLPMSISANIAFPLKLAGIGGKRKVREKVEKALVKAGLWDEVKDRLHDDARGLSGGQQQRLCIARALVSAPEVLLLDEPTSSLDPQSESVIEELLLSLKKECTLVVVSHSNEQVARLADTVFCLRRPSGGSADGQTFKKFDKQVRQ